MLLAACTPALISLHITQAYESTEIKHAFAMRMQVLELFTTDSTLRVCIHCGRKGSVAELEPKALILQLLSYGLHSQLLLLLPILLYGAESFVF
jgi:hypothetical protein